MATAAVRAQGAEDDYYMSLPEPYHCKNAHFDSVDELLLVKGVTPQLLYGYDHNHNGIIDNQETQGGDMGTLINASADTGVGIAASSPHTAFRRPARLRPPRHRVPPRPRSSM